MTSLYNRANDRQRRLLKIIEGAVKNTIDAHPDWITLEPERFARSIAKRAAGTISSEWSEIVGGGKPSDSRAETRIILARPGGDLSVEG